MAEKPRRRPTRGRERKSEGEERGGRSRRNARPKKKSRRLLKLVTLLLLLVVSLIGYNHWKRTGGDPEKLYDTDEFLKSAQQTGENLKSDIENIDTAEILAQIKGKLAELDGYFQANPDARPIETREQLEEALAEPDPVEPASTPAADPETPRPAPAPTARSKARDLYNQARAILRTWSPNQDDKLRQATALLDESLKFAGEANDSHLTRQINEMRYFCLKARSTH